jgi:hypothetical protein
MQATVPLMFASISLPVIFVGVFATTITVDWLVARLVKHW